MAQHASLSLKQYVSLTDEALIVVEGRTKKVLYCSPRAMDLLDVPNSSDETVKSSISDLIDPDDGRLDHFLSNAVTLTSPLIAGVKRKSDQAPIIAKGHRITRSDGEPCVLLNISGETELSRRFRLLADKIAALNEEIDQRKIAESKLSESAHALERALISVRQLSELDSSDPNHLTEALVFLATACGCAGAMIVGVDMGHATIMATQGNTRDHFETGMLVDMPMGFVKLHELPPGEQCKIIRVALQKAATSEVDLSDIELLPLHFGNEPRACIVLNQPEAVGPMTAIIAEALANLMSRANIERNYRHAQKLQAIGQLTGGIAHDFNNILAVILGNAELILDHVSPLGSDSIEVELAQAIRDATLRGATLTSRLLSFARKQHLKPQTLNLNVVLRDLDTLLRRAIGGRIGIECVAAGGLWRTRLDRDQFENAVLNLALNARDAMPNGGKLTIETGNSRLDDDYAAQHLEVTPGQYVMVAVTDTGVGMTPDIVREAFTPFFTTKGVGKGSGLGLSMVFGFVKQSGGHVKIYSEPDQGTTVRMYFPRDISDVGTDHAQYSVRSDRGMEAQGRVLLVEDDPAILLYTKRTLEFLGYTVDAVLTGDAAADLVQSYTYDILLTDVVLPGRLNGAELARFSITVLPSIRVLFMSGYTENAIVHNGQLDPGVELISKPFTRDQLARRLRNLKSAGD